MKGEAVSGVIRIRYLASLREAVGRSSEDLRASGPTALSAVLEWLRGEMSAAAFTQLRRDGVRMALNQELLASEDVQVAPGDELAFLPPVTGG